MDDFLNDNPNSNISSVRNFSEDWIQYILEYPMPNIENEQEQKETIVRMLMPVINVGAKSNLKRPDIRLFLWEYDNTWKAYFMYKRKGKYDADMLVLKRALKAGFALMLHRSVEMGQMRMIFEPKQSIFQRFVNDTQRKLSFFKHGKQKNNNDVEAEN